MQEKNINNLIEAYVSVYDCKKQLSEEVEIDEGRKEPNLDKMKRQENRHQEKAVRQIGGSRGVSKNRAFKMSGIRGALERGEDPRADTYGGARTARGNAPEDHRAGFSKNPLNNPPRRVKEPGVKKEEVETDLFDYLLEYLVAEGYADTNKAALAIMANMSEEWKQDIVEGMTIKDFKQQRSRQKQKEKRAAEKTSPLRRAGIHADKASPERAARHRANVDPDYDYGDEEQMYPGGKLKNPKKIRKAKALGELGEEYVDEAAKDQSNKQIEKGVKTTYKAGNVLDNQHQGRSRGLSRLPAGERQAKTKRMRERLKDRRNDLFKERGNREDAARAELKKRLGL